MTGGELATSFSYLGMALSASMNLPQLVRSWHGESIVGVSCTAWLLSAFCPALWCVYGFTRPVFAQIPGNAVAFASATLVVITLVRHGIPAAWPATAAVTFAAVAGAGYVAGGPIVIGWMASVLSIMRTLPQLWTCVRAPAVDGISASAWMLTAAASITWLGYAALADDPPVIGSSGSCLVIAGSILLVLNVRRLRSVPVLVSQPAI